MASKSIDSASLFRKFHRENASGAFGNLTTEMHQLKKQIQTERVVSIQGKIEENRKKLEGHVYELMLAASSRSVVSVVEKSLLGELLSSRLENPLCKFSGLAQGSVDRENLSIPEIVVSASAKLPYIEKIPTYTTWIFLERNQRMAEDQSVVGRRRIYYDPHGSEALIYSDSEEEIAEQEAEKHKFSKAEDHILWMAFSEHGPGEEVLNVVSQHVGGTASEIEERYSMLKEKNHEKHNREFKDSGELGLERSIFLDKSLSAALDSFDNLFCRRCLVFDCRLHGCSQSLVNPSKKKSCTSESDEDGRPCSDQCYLRVRVVKDLSEGSAVGDSHIASKTLEEEGGKTPVSRNAQERAPHSGYMGKRKVQSRTHTVPEDSALVSDEIQGSSKKQKKLSALSKWKPLEKELYLKGIEIFGRNSCLIARNLLSGLKTCIDVSSYMYDDGAAMPHGSSIVPSSYLEDKEKADPGYMEQVVPARSRLLHRRGRPRKHKYSWKSAGHPSIWKRNADGKNQSFKQYTPCGCESMCGKQCPCLHNGTCCEKYCGCSKNCKNRFRGCHCAKSQCRSRQCPCFAAGRECDPDVCRNCWVSCGDGSFGEPPRRGDGQCGNMRLLLRQQQRILLGKSDVTGWGAFLKNPVNKNDYLGEYTGELISHREADKRGKIYDLVNSSFLFDLNDQYVLDAYRNGDKLKFANHSSNPNCYAKVMFVAGDHRVGIFAKERIDAGEELFYDYRYGPDQAPAWARRPEGSKEDDLSISQGRAKKHQSH